MYSDSRLLGFTLCLATAATAAAATLRVCSDPNNLPYSNEQKQGFENQIAQLIAEDMGVHVEYFWFRQGEKFFRKTLNSGACDVVMGVPAGFDEAASTQPYYRSTYVFMTRRANRLNIRSFDDPRLRSLKIGIQILGDEKDSLPPAHALISRGIVKNLVGFSIFGNLNETNPAADVIHALEQGKVDLAVVWGPLGGYFSRHSSVPLDITPVEGDAKNPELPFQYAIGIGVRARDVALRQTLDRELQRRRPEIEAILSEYGIPQVPLQAESARTQLDKGRTE